MGFTAENPGVLTTVQDGGRFGYESFGLSPSGPMDLKAFRTANILAGNPWEESALEATAAGPSLRFDAPAVIAVTGADMSPKLNGVPCPMYQSVAVQGGDLLQLGAARSGCRSYVAFAGGLDVPLVMGSRATALMNQVGGLEGRKLQRGDRIGIRTPSRPLETLAGRKAPVPPPQGREVTLRVILGPQEDAFTEEGLQTFLTQPYRVSPDFNRQGCRLEGPVIAHRTDGNIISDGMTAGCIQVPTSGQPIIMLAERQTAGGYTKIAAVISADLPLAGQCRAGDTVRFQAVTVQEAHRLWRELDRELRDLQQRLDSQETAAQGEPAVSHYRITVNGRVFELQVTGVQ